MELEPPKEAIMAGYNMMKAREGAMSAGGYYQPYLSHAINCVHEVGPEILKKSKLHYFDASPGLALLHEASEILGDPTTTFHGWHRAAQLIGSAHQNFARAMKRAGYRDITKRDFAEFGSGGGR